jgi:hypothetical protein
MMKGTRNENVYGLDVSRWQYVLTSINHSYRFRNGRRTFSQSSDPPMSESELKVLQTQIKTVEAEIKAIQSQLLRNRCGRVQPSAPSVPSSASAYPGLPPEHIEYLQKHEYEISVKRQKKAELDGLNSRLRDELAAEQSEIQTTERMISDVRSQVSGLIHRKTQLRSSHTAATRDLTDRKIEVKAMKRLCREVTTTISAVAMRKDIPITDRSDLRPLREEILRLENETRFTNNRIHELLELIRLEETILATPIKNSEAEKEVLKSLDDQESQTIEFDVLELRQQVAAKQRELREVQNAVRQSHIRASAGRPSDSGEGRAVRKSPN